MTLNLNTRSDVVSGRLDRKMKMNTKMRMRMKVKFEVKRRVRMMSLVSGCGFVAPR